MRKRTYELNDPAGAVTVGFLFPAEEPSEETESGYGAESVKVTAAQIVALGGGITGTGSASRVPYIVTSPGGNIATLGQTSLSYGPNAQGTGNAVLASNIQNTTFAQDRYILTLGVDDGNTHISYVTVSMTNGNLFSSTDANLFAQKPISYQSGLAGTVANRVVVMNSNHEFVTASATISDVNQLVGVTDLVQTQLDSKESLSNKDANFGYAGLDGDGKINPLQLPALAVTNTFVVASQVAMLALSVEPGDVAIRTDENKTYILQGTDPTNLADWQEMLAPLAGVSSVFGRTGAVTAQSGDYTTSQVTEGSNLYYTDARARAAITGTTNRVTVIAGVVDISSSYVGQTSITTLGTIGTGTWHGTAVELTYGGTGANLSATGGTSQVLKQNTVGGTITVAQLAASDLSNGTTGSGSVVLASGPAITGHPTIEGVTSTGATGTGKFVFDTAPTIVTSVTVPQIIGGTAVGSTVTIKATSNGSNTASASLFNFISSGTTPVLTFGDFGGAGDNFFFSAQITPSSSNYWLRATASVSYFNASSDLRMQIGGSNIIICSSTTATMSQGITISDAKNIVLNTTTGTKIGTATGQKLAFWNATPIVQPSSANQAALTDSTTGTPSFTLVDVGAAFSQANINNNFSSLYRVMNEMRNVLVNTGLMKGSA